MKDINRLQLQQIRSCLTQHRRTTHDIPLQWAEQDCRAAGVLIPLLRHLEQWHVPATEALGTPVASSTCLAAWSTPRAISLPSCADCEMASVARMTRTQRTHRGAWRTKDVCSGVGMAWTSGWSIQHECREPDPRNHSWVRRCSGHAIEDLASLEASSLVRGRVEMTLRVISRCGFGVSDISHLDMQSSAAARNTEYARRAAPSMRLRRTT